MHVNNHLHAKTLFVAYCKMSNKHLIAGYHHDKQNITTSRVWTICLFSSIESVLLLLQLGLQVVLSTLMTLRMDSARSHITFLQKYTH